jgi:hypothetical protein
MEVRMGIKQDVCSPLVTDGQYILIRATKNPYFI